MNIVTASFNTTMRQMTEMFHMTKMSQQKMTEMSQKKTEPLSSGVFRSFNQGAKLSKMLKHMAILSILFVMAVCFSILLVHRYV